MSTTMGSKPTAEERSSSRRICAGNNFDRCCKRKRKSKIVGEFSVKSQRQTFFPYSIVKTSNKIIAYSDFSFVIECQWRWEVTDCYDLTWKEIAREIISTDLGNGSRKFWENFLSNHNVWLLSLTYSIVKMSNNCLFGFQFCLRMSMTMGSKPTIKVTAEERSSSRRNSKSNDVQRSRSGERGPNSGGSRKSSMSETNVKHFNSHNGPSE